MFPIRSFLQLLLDDKLVALIVTVETDEGVKQCTTVLIQLSDLERRSEFVPENVKFTLSADDIANDDGTALLEMETNPFSSSRRSACCCGRVGARPYSSPRTLVTSRHQIAERVG
jgi:hypothetical protein